LRDDEVIPRPQHGGVLGEASDMPIVRREKHTLRLQPRSEVNEGLREARDQRC
jgi:hypothetical protein